MINFKAFLVEKQNFPDIKLSGSRVASFNPKHAGFDWVIGNDWVNFSRTTYRLNGKKYNIVNSSDISPDDYKKIINNFLLKTEQLGTDGIVSFKNNPNGTTHENFKRTKHVSEIWKSIDGAIKDGTTFMLGRK